MSAEIIEIRGAKELEKAIREAYSGPKARKALKEAANAGGDLMVKRLKEKFDTFKATGYSEDEIMRSNAQTKRNIEGIKVGWNGPENRWRMIHLNEFGYTRKGKQYTPSGFGAIEKTIEETREEYLKVVADEMRKRL